MGEKTGACKFWMWNLTKRDHLEDLDQSWRTLLRAHAKLSIKFRESLSHGHGNFEDQNKFLEPSVIIINDCIIISAYYNSIVQLIQSIIIILHF